MGLLCYDSFCSFMYTNKIAGGSVALAIGLASSEFAKALTMKAIIPFLQRLLEDFGGHTVFGPVTEYDLHHISTMALYWLCIIGVSYVISEYIFGRWLLGTATILTSTGKKSMKEAQKVLEQEPGALQAARDAVNAVVQSTFQNVYKTG